MKKINFLGDKYVKITMEVVVKYNADEMDIQEVVDSAVTCFYEEDKYGNEMFLPKTETMVVHEYINTTFVDVTDDIAL
jgi:hypothetical protein